MEDITKQNFMYCLQAKEGRGCLCAAMFYFYKVDDKIEIHFKAGNDKYAEKTRNAWKVPSTTEDAMEGFYEVCKETFEFLEKNYNQDCENWWARYISFDDENRVVTLYDLPDRSAPNGDSEDFWIQEYNITKKMFDKGYLNGNYPQGHYTMNGQTLTLLCSYFGAYTGSKLKPNFIKSLQSCHKISDSNLKKNWLIDKVVKNDSVMSEITAEDFWRLSLASQMYNSSIYKDEYCKKFLKLLGPSENKEYQDYINAVLENSYEEYKIDYEYMTKKYAPILVMI